jgi:hypothetical protein
MRFKKLTLTILKNQNKKLVNALCLEKLNETLAVLISEPQRLEALTQSGMNFYLSQKAALLNKK